MRRQQQRWNNFFLSRYNQKPSNRASFLHPPWNMTNKKYVWTFAVTKFVRMRWLVRLETNWTWKTEQQQQQNRTESGPNSFLECAEPAPKLKNTLFSRCSKHGMGNGFLHDYLVALFCCSGCINKTLWSRFSVQSNKHTTNHLKTQERKIVDNTVGLWWCVCSVGTFCGLTLSRSRSSRF